MRRSLAAFTVGVILGAVLLFLVIEASGGWYTYRILSEQECAGPRGLGTSTVAPSQPNPCLIRTSRFMP